MPNVLWFYATGRGHTYIAGRNANIAILLLDHLAVDSDSIRGIYVLSRSHLILSIVIILSRLSSPRKVPALGFIFVSWQSLFLDFIHRILV